MKDPMEREPITKRWVQIWFEIVLHELEWISSHIEPTE
jgi:hypothetical protein